ncbi:type II secretion system protein [Ornithinibacillus halophilus]|uniref:type II secretion system protein n=1 Tax=Ornithinibacillus halophilus TaxID=930117 RepID=UPI000934090D|nr:type II secretion system protein [Ornithinibacillus halophilus]
MKKYNGFSLIEVLIASSIVFMVAITLVPLISTLNAEREALSIKRLVANELHDQLQLQLWNLETVTQFKREFNNFEVHFSFYEEKGSIKGCAKWINVKQKEENLCIYGLPKS